MGSRTKDGDTLAHEIHKVAEEIKEVCADTSKVRTATTDRASANKVSWQKLHEHGIEGVPDAVHAHNSMFGDMYATVPWL